MTLSLYSGIFSIYLLLIMMIPAIVIGLMGKSSKIYGMLVSIVFISLIMGLGTFKMIQFLAFILCQAILVKLYQYIHGKTKNKWLYFLVLFFSIFPIFAVKLCAHSSRFSVLGFVGISYISFRVWQLIIEIHDDHIDKLPILDMLYFITFFPCLQSGPIDRYGRFLKDLENNVSGSEYVNEYLICGLKKICIGIFYKFAVASIINNFVLDKLPKEVTFLSAIIYMYAYTLYLFFDFAGYSNLAIGVSNILKIKSPENFDKPFLAKNMKEFWDRWHMSLSKWFGDYLFSRFVLNTLRNGTFKSKKIAVRCGYMLTMTVMGLWHGFYLFYLIYGIYEGLMLVITDIYLKSKIYRKFKKSRYFEPISIFVCFNVISFGMLLFSGYLFKF